MIKAAQRQRAYRYLISIPLLGPVSVAQIMATHAASKKTNVINNRSAVFVFIINRLLFCPSVLRIIVIPSGIGITFLQHDLNSNSCRKGVHITTLLKRAKASLIVWRAVLEDNLPLSAAPGTKRCASMVILEGFAFVLTLRLRTMDHRGAVISD